MVVLSSLGDSNFQQLLSLLPPHIHVRNLKVLSREEIHKTQPDLLFLEASFFIDPVSSLNSAPGFPENIIIWGCEGDDIRQIIPLVEQGIHYCSYPIEKEHLSDFLLMKSTPVQSEKNEYPDMGIIGTSKAICDVRKVIKKYGPFQDAVTLSGETGTGKEITAMALHKYSGRSGPFIPVNSAAIPETLLESEMFGSVRGAFTDSVNKPGYFESAHGGTLFLDEIGEMPLSVQSKLLRVLEDKQLTRLGSTSRRTVDVRIISATSKDLKQMMEEGLFRKDLYYRLNVLIIDLPPLRYRKKDIPLLCRFLMDKEKSTKSIHPDAMMKLLDYSWPGNVRELRSILRKADILSESMTEINKKHIQYF
ncbi:sigma 54-interacting transcriptional regulator [Oceanispirochaeta sp.]|jgi:transcriptional regulator with PAS, ATPase and Fis domain|uniref:sigma 54-interacting transcriptional regulator n=1 Tax=Oceanispirochaeta sp. TaxID=2035350 RepID=UPI002624B382|nr:sigma 54-interacting transcriptional regulator [Oceanispirochaeta sp.]MDA3955496.1 sigma 54-interacting transcriptional regulator [Oceanispirochaeta sp.]